MVCMNANVHFHKEHIFCMQRCFTGKILCMQFISCFKNNREEAEMANQQFHKVLGGNMCKSKHL